MKASWLLLASILAAQSGCHTEPDPELPENLVREFVERMRRVHGDRVNARAAYDLLWSEARNNLAERAKRASALAGRKIAPEEMVVPSRFSLNYQPKTYTAEIQGEWASVVISGDDPATQRNIVPVVRESGHWRVAIRFPLLPPIRKRMKDEGEAD